LTQTCIIVLTEPEVYVIDPRPHPIVHCSGAGWHE